MRFPTVDRRSYEILEELESNGQLPQRGTGNRLPQLTEDGLIELTHLDAAKGGRGLEAEPLYRVTEAGSQTVEENRPVFEKDGRVFEALWGSRNPQSTLAKWRRHTGNMIVHQAVRTTVLFVFLSTLGAGMGGPALSNMGSLARYAFFVGGVGLTGAIRGGVELARSTVRSSRDRSNDERPARRESGERETGRESTREAGRESGREGGREAGREGAPEAAREVETPEQATPSHEIEAPGKSGKRERPQSFPFDITG